MTVDPTNDGLTQVKVALDGEAAVKAATELSMIFSLEDQRLLREAPNITVMNTESSIRTFIDTKRREAYVANAYDVFETYVKDQKYETKLKLSSVQVADGEIIGFDFVTTTKQHIILGRSFINNLTGGMQYKIALTEGWLSANFICGGMSDDNFEIKTSDLNLKLRYHDYDWDAIREKHNNFEAEL